MSRSRAILLVAFAILIFLAAFFALSSTGRQIISTILNRPPVVVKPVSYLCPVVDYTAPEETATCTDCTFYPVDRTHSLPANYTPILVFTGLPGGGQVAASARQPLQQLFADANAHGFSPVVTSAYRSYSDQAVTFRSWVFQEWENTTNIFQAVVNAEQYSAWEGHSEHQLGTAVDINCQACAPFDTTDSRNLALWKYLEDNAHRFGFVISYPRNMDARTGYEYEPWHIRFIGVAAATALNNQGYAHGNGICALALLRAETGSAH